MATSGDGNASAAYIQRRRFRSSWAAAAFHQHEFETQHRADTEHKDWYELQQRGQLSEELAGKFVQLQQDAETDAFLENCYDKSGYMLTQMYQRLAKGFLSMFMSVTSANGLLKRGSMLVLTSEQFLLLIGRGKREEAAGEGQEPMYESLLDLGAGDGHVTSQYAKFFKRVYATEMSTVMTWRLAERGFTVLDPHDWSAGQPYDVIGCVNLLDRCSAPVDLLADAKARLRSSTGRLLLAVVLPLSQYCEFTSDRRPEQRLLVQGTTFEQQVNSLVSDLLEPLGWAVERWTKLPYLCEGDLYQSFYYLSDAVFLLRPK